MQLPQLAALRDERDVGIGQLLARVDAQRRQPSASIEDGTETRRGDARATDEQVPQLRHLLADHHEVRVLQPITAPQKQRPELREARDAVQARAAEVAALPDVERRVAVRRGRSSRCRAEHRP